MLALDDLEHAVQILGKPQLVHHEGLVPLQIEFPILLRQVQVVRLVVLQIRHGGLLEAHEVFRQTFLRRPEETFLEVRRLLNLFVWSLANKHSYLF